MKEKDKEYILSQIDNINDIGELSDGFHTYDSLYFQRMVLFAALVKTYPDISWKSYRHEDEELCFGGRWFIVGIDTPDGTYTYHYENKYWDYFHCVELYKAPHWDGHTDKDVERLLSLVDDTLCGKEHKQLAEWLIELKSYRVSFTKETQKHTDKDEQKFKVGNWYQCIKDFFGKGVTFDKNTAYYCAQEGCLQNEYGCHIAIVKDLYDNFKLWTIADAKCGGVLISSLYKQPFVYNGNYTCDTLGAYFGLNHQGEVLIGSSHDNNWTRITGVQPATKEQCNILFKKLHDSDFKWDSEKKELWHKYL